ncbi:cysteine synthase A [Actinomyces urogenitalis DSM 15434]|uniref:Cysteine synthase n=2 Tax=Actinomyces urogenitalis TaxID=103621 RepID=C0W717_9ACTO|nr:cysteine synthase A [Actinomyces urogenitalis]ETJ06530.1 MAG: Cysteine synthase [Actinomyces urogenitalis DORA_12]EEH65496.1 cysteine synthase A [Actinomyces urogenitalis DSM 15434]MBS5976611.1 cysteine synthase A [Actinomyces urogenitalis]MBS6071080.1 cysteine synthase A [Actinomyces urogenitalis]MDK8835247.1 cysteine synthase A [Actinomyces urogenitalis]
MAYLSNITEAVGNTPLVKINRVISGPATVLAKVEAFEPASSVKDRIALSIVRAAEAAGALKPGGTIVEATSGNTGVGLAMVGAALGYRVVITMPETMSKERRAIMRAFGAELVLTSEGGVAGAVKKAQEIQAATENSILASQFTNPANPKVHRETTALEILEQAGTVDAFVAGIGTGGTLTGVGTVLRERVPGVKIYGVEPAESPLLSEGHAAPHKIQGLGPNMVPEVLDQGIWDELLHISSEDALTYARRAAKEEGLLVGISSGAALAAADLLSQRPELEGKTIVTVLPDTGERYLSTPLYADYLS